MAVAKRAPHPGILRAGRHSASARRGTRPGYRLGKSCGSTCGRWARLAAKRAARRDRRARAGRRGALRQPGRPLPGAAWCATGSSTAPASARSSNYRPVLAPWHGGPVPDGDAVDRAAHREPPRRPPSRWRSTCAAAATPTCGRGRRAAPGARGSASSTRVALEPWAAGRHSCIWRFNALYWQALSLWEQATGREYEQALPGGESDARNTAAVRELILELFKTWDDLDSRTRCPPSCTSPSSGSATATRRGPGWTSSSSCPGRTAATTTAACNTSWATTRRTCSAGR